MMYKKEAYLIKLALIWLVLLSSLAHPHGRGINVIKGLSEEDIQSFLSMHGFEEVEALDSVPDPLTNLALFTSQVSTAKRVQQFNTKTELARIDEEQIRFSLQPYTNYNEGKTVYIYNSIMNSIPVTVFVNSDGYIHSISDDLRNFSIFHSSMRYNSMERLFLFEIAETEKR